MVKVMQLSSPPIPEATSTFNITYKSIENPLLVFGY